MKTRKRCYSWIAFLLILAMLPITAFAVGTDSEETAETPTVTVYLSMSHDAAFLQPTASDAVMALKKLEVPYFDLALYGLENFYFSSETYGDDGDGEPGSALEPGTKEFAEGKITMMHLFIYATEVFYCGIRPEDAGKGLLATNRMLGTEAMTITGSVGSSYLSNFWGMDENLNYYLNYEYPLASPGWGATSDQILLEDGDLVTLGHFTNWNFYKDPASVFNYIKAGADTVTTAAVRGEQVSMTAYRAGANAGAPGSKSLDQGDYTTAHTTLTSCPEVYCVAVEDLSSGDVDNLDFWTYVTTAAADGSFTVDTSQMEPGEYLICIPGQYGVGETTKNAICSTPGGIILTVEEPQIVYGDVNGDGKVNSTDAALTYAVHNGKRSFTQAQQQAADVNGDGKINSTDAALIYAVHNGKRQTFPIEAS